MTCRPGQSIRESQALLIQSTTGTLVITDEANKLLGIVTLHDLLRTQLESRNERDEEVTRLLSGFRAAGE